MCDGARFFVLALFVVTVWFAVGVISEIKDVIRGYRR